MIFNILNFLKKSILLFIFIAFQQVSASVYKNISQEKETSQKQVDSLKKLYDKYLNIAPDSALVVTQKRLDLVNDLGMEYEKIIAISNLGYLKKKSGLYEEGLKYYFEALKKMKLLRANNNLDELSKEKQLQLSHIYFGIGSAYQGINYDILALKYYKKAEETSDDDNLKLRVLYNKAVLYKANGDYTYAEKLQLKLLKLNKKSQQKNDIGFSYSALSTINESKKEFKKAVKYIDSAITIYTELKYVDQLASALNNKAVFLIQADSEQYDNAIELLDRSLLISQKSDNKKLIISNKRNRGFIYFYLKKYKLAEESMIDALQNAKEFLYNNITEKTYTDLIELYTINNDQENLVKYKSELLDFRESNEENKNDEILIKEKYTIDLDAQADLFDFRENIYRKSNKILMIVLSCIGIQLLVLFILTQRKKEVTLA